MVTRPLATRICREIQDARMAFQIMGINGVIERIAGAEGFRLGFGTTSVHQYAPSFVLGRLELPGSKPR